MPTLLVIDEEPAIRHAFQKAFGAPVAVRIATPAAEGLAAGVECLAARRSSH